MPVGKRFRALYEEGLIIRDKYLYNAVLAFSMCFLKANALMDASIGK